jgi:hypoxanthine phosphoribosyltransferase
MAGLEKDIAKILITRDQLTARIAEMGQNISRDYAGKDLFLVCVLKGGVVFLSDLVRAIHVPHSFDFMAISSYGGTHTESSGVVRILMDLNASIEGRNVLIVEDIIDTGRTLAYITENLRTRSGARLCGF